MEDTFEQDNDASMNNYYDDNGGDDSYGMMDSNNAIKNTLLLLNTYTAPQSFVQYTEHKAAMKEKIAKKVAAMSEEQVVMAAEAIFNNE